MAPHSEAVSSESVEALSSESDSAWGDDTTGEGALSTLTTGTWDPKHDYGSMWNTTKQTGAQDVWAMNDPKRSALKLTGHGVGVALIDTGIAPVDGLAGSGKVVNGPDLSFESQASNTRYLDGYGHGTHMAAIIAGKDSAVVAGKESDDKNFVGMAPDAKLVNVRVGAADGGADVSQVIAAVDWVVQHRAEHNIRVLNLSYSTKSSQKSTIDPLAHAVENAWRAGIVVVVAAGNDGEKGATTLTMPAVDPYVIAVGSSNNLGSNKPKDTTVGAWTNPGTSARRPDLLAPGKSVVSLRVPGSSADTEHPEGLIPGDSTGRMFRGTGTSQSAAVVSGAAALLLQRNPELTPDQVKGLLRSSADLLKVSNPTQGAGTLNVKRAVALLEKGSVAAYQQSWSPSTGLGSLEAARGGSHVVDPDNGDVLSGEKDIFGVAWNAPAWAAASAQQRSWSDGTLRGSQWAGTGWDGSSGAAVDWSRRSWSDLEWSHRSWSGRSWSGRSWSEADWARRSWSRVSWSADDWARVSWSRVSWSRVSWSRVSWSADDWARRSWSADDWARRSWSADDWSASRWSASRWSASRWSSARWSSARWSSARWSASRWSANDWSRISWSGRSWS